MCKVIKKVKEMVYKSFKHFQFKSYRRLNKKKKIAVVKL